MSFSDSDLGQILGQHGAHNRSRWINQFGLARRLAAHGPEKLILVDIDESGLFNLHAESGICWTAEPRSR